MKKYLVSLPVLMALSASASLAHGADRGLPKVTLAGKAISIDYGRPSLGGRDMLSRLPPGESWRMGADADTTLKTEAELAFGSTMVPKGEYVLTAKRSAEGKWTLVLSNSDRTVEVPLAEQKLAESVEVFTIELGGKGSKGQFLMKWALLALSAPFTAK